jgi:C4-dicarboxylate-specific signal transduction histidine kinase
MENQSTILIIDDTEANVNTLMDLLDEKYDILASLEPKDGLELLDEEDVDLILLDIMMPDINGFEVCKIVKSNPKTTDIPVIFITSKTDEDAIEKAYEVGGVDYITKPFKAREVLSRVHTHLYISEQKHNLEDKIKTEVEKNLKKEKQLIEQSKMANMGSMIGNIAHQWRQPLSAINAIASGIHLKSQMNKINKEELEDDMELIKQRIEYLSDNMNTFRNFLKEKKEKREVFLEDRINLALQIVGLSIKDNHIKLINNIDYSNKTKMTMVVGELDEVIINIINNAKDVLIDKKIQEPWIKIELETNLTDAIITIEDNGGGIPNNILPNIFDEYFTTKSDEKGTGLGLYMSKKIIEDSLKGKLEVTNTTNGAKFFIKLLKN